jgi:pimeloyl-ACP methyl ester carboxylesterase
MLDSGVELNYVDAGTGTPVVFIPGWMASIEFYRHQLAHVAENHRAISYDPRSQGDNVSGLGRPGLGRCGCHDRGAARRGCRPGSWWRAPGTTLSSWSATPWRPAADLQTGVRTVRASTPQIALPHIVQSLGLQILRERLPDVLALLDAGAHEVTLASQVPPTVENFVPAPGDEQMPAVMTRRAPLDWVLARAAAAQPRLELPGRCRHGLRARTAPFAPGASNDTVWTSTNPVACNHCSYSSAV